MKHLLDTDSHAKLSSTTCGMPSAGHDWSLETPTGFSWVGLATAFSALIFAAFVSLNGTGCTTEPIIVTVVVEREVVIEKEVEVEVTVEVLKEVVKEIPVYETVVVEKEVIVEREVKIEVPVEVVKEIPELQTAVVEKQIEVPVIQTVVVEKQVEVAVARTVPAEGQSKFEAIRTVVADDSAVSDATEEVEEAESKNATLDGVSSQSTTSPQVEGQIAFLSDRDRENDTWDLYKIDADGSGVIRLSGGSPYEDVENFRWSPTGRHIAFTSRVQHDLKYNTGSHVQAYVVKADGSRLTPLTDREDSDDFSTIESWSADGERIALSSSNDREVHPVKAGRTRGVLGFDIYAARADGSNLTRITHGEGSEHVISAKWAPGGNHLAFLRSRISDVVRR